MSTELVLLLGIFAFILGGLFISDENGLKKTLRDSTPRLGAHVERQLSIGHRFQFRDGTGIQWRRPSEAPPLGEP